MTYLTQAFVDYHSAAKYRLSDTYAWHKAVWKAFPGNPDGKRDFLTRLDRQEQGFRLLIVSPDAPQRPDWCTGAEDWKTTEISDSYFTAHRYFFQLCANPTKKIHTGLPDGTRSKNGRRVPLTSRDELMAWLERKAAQGGFSLDPDITRTLPRGREYFSKGGQLGLHHAVEFRGMLSIIDREKFREAFTHGIGSAKAFGFGLLMAGTSPVDWQAKSQGDYKSIEAD